MPRFKRKADAPPKHLTEEERRRLNRNSNSPNEAASSSSNSTLGGGNVENNSAAKRPRLELTKLDLRLLTTNDNPYLTITYFDGDGADSPGKDFVFLLHEFTIEPKLGEEESFAKFVEENRSENVCQIRLHHPDERWFDRFKILPPSTFLYSPNLSEPAMVYMETSLTKDVFRLLCPKSAFELTFDENFKTIRLWVKRSLFAENVYGKGAQPFSSTNLRRLMPLIQPQICVGHLVDGEATKRKIDDTPQKFYEELKQRRRSMIESAEEKENENRIDLEHPAIIPILRPYQKEAVRWLLKREIDPKLSISENLLFVSIADYRSPTSSFYYNPVGGFFLTDKPRLIKPTFGGVLAEEPGLGKTVEMLSLILLHPKEKKNREAIVDIDNLDLSIDDDESNSTDVRCRLETENAFQEKQLQELRYQRLKQETYRRKIVFKKDESTIDRAIVQCFCGRSTTEIDPSIRLHCPQCDTWQHSSCVHWPEENDDDGDVGWSKIENYLCPSCRCSKSENAVESGTTLIVSPASISDQWYAEIEKHVRKGSLSVYIYRGVQNEGFVQPHALARYDVVIVAYETLKIELNYFENFDQQRRLRKPKRFATAPTPLTAVKWWRLCLDEAQMVEKPSAKAAKMCLNLNAAYKWCVTGTPIQKSIDDLYGLLLLLDVDVYSIRQFWEVGLYSPYVYDVDRRRLLDAVSPLVWRTSKSEVSNQLGIPEQEQRLRWIDFGAVEAHFYKRLKEECAVQVRSVLVDVDVSRRNRDLPLLDRRMKLSDLDRYVLEKLLRPLLKLRQACGHPQLVRQGRFLNLDQLQQRMRVVTMEQVLEEMIKKTRFECEDFHRIYVASLNGLAALEWMNENWARAAEWYRDVLRSCQEHEKQALKATENDEATTSGQEDSAAGVRTDLLQKLHATHNLHVLVGEHRDAVPPTLRDDKLGEECEALKDKYLSQSIALLKKSRASLETIELETKKDLENFDPDWCIRVLQKLSANKSESPLLIERLQQQLMESTKWSTKFRDVNDLSYLITSHHDNLVESRQRLSTGVRNLLIENIDELVREARQCHLDSTNRPPTCSICRVEPIFNDYESRLFNFEQSIDQQQQQSIDNDQLMGPLRRGTWADSDLEKTLKILYLFVKRSPERRLLIEIDDGESLEEAKQYLKVFEQLKQEFRALRSTWMNLRNHVSRRDELRMAVDRLGDFDRSTIDRKTNEFLMERTSGQSNLKKQLGQLTYLENLKKRKGENENGNLEECPVCRTELGKNWRVLTTCGHSICVQCHDVLTNRDQDQSCRCPVCRRTTKRDQVQEVVFKKSTSSSIESKIDNRSEIDNQIRGSQSAKIFDVLRCLLEIRKEDPLAKCLLFSNWVEVLDLVAEALTENRMKYVYLNQRGEKWRRNLTEFKTSRDCNILLLPTKNGANGLNIIEATHVLMIDQSMNPSREQQALGRVHRIGQKKKTVVHRFLVTESIEEKIYRLFGNEAIKVDGELLDEQDSNIPPMIVGDLIDLFEEEEGNGE